MKKRIQRKHIIIRPLLYLSIGFLNTAKGENINTVGQQLTTKISEIQKGQDTKTIIKFFCDATQNLKTYDNAGIDSTFFDAQQSLFFYMLCKEHIQLKEEKYSLDPEQEDKSYFIFTEGVEGQKYPNLEGSKIYNGETETDEYINDIFNNIMNAYFNSKQGNIFGIQSLEDTEDQSATNIAKSFNSKITPNFFINICDETKTEYNYPKTCKKLKEFIKKGKNMIKQGSKNINLKNIKGGYNPEQCTLTNEKSNYQIIPCGLMSTMKNFSTLLYNELMIYELFIAYYTQALQIDLSLSNTTNDLSKQTFTQQEKITTMYQNLENQKKAILLSLRTLNQIDMTFALHIGFLMYGEDLIGFGKEFTKILTPISTFYDIFRNVQAPK